MASKPHIVCSNCTVPVKLNQRICPSCGIPLDWSEDPVVRSSGKKIVCEACGVPNRPGSAKCSSCGSELNASTRQSLDESVRKKKSDVRPAQKLSLKHRDRFVFFTLGIITSLMIGLFLVQAKVITLITSEEKGQSSPVSAQATAPVADPMLLAEIQMLEKAATDNPTDAGAIVRYANALHDARYIARAIDQYQRYLKLRSNDADARVDLGICYFESEQPERAILEMTTALKKAPNHQKAMFNLGVITLNLGRISESNEWFRKSIKANPSTEIAKRAEQLVNQHAPLPNITQ